MKIEHRVNYSKTIPYFPCIPALKTDVLVFVTLQLFCSATQHRRDFTMNDRWRKVSDWNTSYFLWLKNNWYLHFTICHRINKTFEINRLYNGLKMYELTLLNYPTQYKPENIEMVTISEGPAIIIHIWINGNFWLKILTLSCNLKIYQSSYNFSFNIIIPYIQVLSLMLKD